MSALTQDIDRAWMLACKLYGLSDTPEMRHAFYHGCRYVLTEISLKPDAFTDEGADLLLALNDDMRRFATAALAMRKSESVA